MDALLKALEVRGYSAKVSGHNELVSTYVLIGEEKLKIRLSENSIRSEREFTAMEKKQPSYTLPNKWIYTPSGKLTFEIDEYTDGLQKKWTDRTNKPLQEQLNEILTGLILAGEFLRLRSIKHDEEQRKRDEQTQRRREEEERCNHLNEHWKAWTKSQQLREFLQACEKFLIERKGKIAPDSPEAKWLRWAYQYVDRIDPLKNGSVEETIFRLS